MNAPRTGAYSNLDQLREEALALLAKVEDLKDLDAARVKYLGKKGSIKALQKSLGSLPAEERPVFGAEVNRLHDEIETRVERLRAELEEKELQRRLEESRIDYSLPGRDVSSGAYHPITLMIRQVTSVFERMGYDVYDHREIETDYYNFEALNFPDDHPARDMQDTFFLSEDLLLRSHTSNSQIHYMEAHKPPFKVIVPGRVYRRDSDPTHSPIFHQIEGLMVGKGISFANLKWTLETFIREIYGAEAKLRFRPSFFPFTEPSAEVDLWFETEPGKGRWLEMLGAGMVDPNVLRICHIDPEEWTGFAFGVGVERMAMVRYGIPDIRLLYENNVRILQQFKGLS